jgi:DNA-binding NtrC family response regulator
MPRVLIVEDDALVCLARLEELEDRGYEVVSMLDAASAIDHLRAHDVDVLLTDVNLPGAIDGVQLAQWVTHYRPEVLVLVRSGRYEAKRHLGTLADKVPFFPKPFDVGDVDRHISQVLNRP